MSDSSCDYVWRRASHRGHVVILLKSLSDLLSAMKLVNVTSSVTTNLAAISTLNSHNSRQIWCWNLLSTTCLNDIKQMRASMQICRNDYVKMFEEWIWMNPFQSRNIHALDEITKRNETKWNETKQSETKRNEPPKRKTKHKIQTKFVNYPFISRKWNLWTTKHKREAGSRTILNNERHSNF